jgi:hypothetical protein
VLQAHLNEKSALPLERAELADYIVTYINSVQRNQKAELLTDYLGSQEPEHTVWLQGIAYARVYRGPHAPIERAVGVDFAGRARLESLVFAPGSARAGPGEDLLLRTRWRPASAPAGLTTALWLRGSDGRTVVEHRQPLQGALLEADLLIVDARLRLPSNLRPGAYTLLARLDDATGRSLPTASSEPAVALQQVSIVPARTR